MLLNLLRAITDFAVLVARLTPPQYPDADAASAFPAQAICSRGAMACFGEAIIGREHRPQSWKNQSSRPA